MTRKTHTHKSSEAGTRSWANTRKKVYRIIEFNWKGWLKPCIEQGIQNKNQEGFQEGLLLV